MNEPFTDFAATTFDRLWDEAMTQPGHTTTGRLPDGWDGEVHCAVQVSGDEGIVVLDAPADRLVAAIESALSAREWYVKRRFAARPSGAASPIRYQIIVGRRRRV